MGAVRTIFTAAAVLSFMAPVPAVAEPDARTVAVRGDCVRGGSFVLRDRMTPDATYVTVALHDVDRRWWHVRYRQSAGGPYDPAHDVETDVRAHDREVRWKHTAPPATLAHTTPDGTVRFGQLKAHPSYAHNGCRGTWSESEYDGNRAVAVVGDGINAEVIRRPSGELTVWGRFWFVGCRTGTHWTFDLDVRFSEAAGSIHRDVRCRNSTAGFEEHDALTALETADDLPVFFRLVVHGPHARTYRVAYEASSPMP